MFDREVTGRKPGGGAGSKSPAADGAVDTVFKIVAGDLLRGRLNRKSGGQQKKKWPSRQH